MNIKQILSALVSDESGQDLVEYALVVAVIALGSVSVLSPLSAAINAAFTSITTKVTAATPA